MQDTFFFFLGQPGGGGLIWLRLADFASLRSPDLSWQVGWPLVISWLYSRLAD